MKKAIEVLRLNIASVKDLHSLYDTFSRTSTNLDLSEILRAEIVLAVSALDCFIHDLVRIGSVEVYEGTRDFTNNTFQPDFDTRKFINLLTKNKEEQLGEIDKKIRETHKTKSFQNPDIIAEIVRKIGIENLWVPVSSRMGINNPQELKNTLELIITRRNQIAHEADIGYENNSKREIDKDEVLKNIIFIENICEEIYKLC
ncbi:MAG: hypothetical protein EAZ85_01565 [Bacteroidetes bacterium]|nr:MAG: hypothetical protein EAZ85_01565 [Bacteroidota bacterium]